MNHYKDPNSFYPFHLPETEGIAKKTDAFNNKGAALIIAYITLTVLLTLSAGFALSTFSTLSQSSRYRDSEKAFWLAEGGINEFMKNPAMLDGKQSVTLGDEPTAVLISKDDSNPRVRRVTSAATVRGIRRRIQITYPADIPAVFKNTVNVKGDIQMTGNKSTVIFNDKTRLSGNISYEAKHASVYFEDIRQSIPGGEVSLSYPDMNGNGKSDEFADFVLFNRNLISHYPKDQVVYIHDSGTYTLTPNESLKEKKIIFVEGRENHGNVIIQFPGAWGEDENLTVISTGRVTLNQLGAMPSSSQLNIIAWSDYNEVAVLPGSHNGIIFTHGAANFDDIHDTSVTNGCVIAGKGIVIGEIWSTKTFNYRDMRVNGKLPPGFEGLMTAGNTHYLDIPNSWREK